MSKVIVFDLDETLRSLETSVKNDNRVNVILRPKILELLEKVKEVKKQGVDSVIFTTASLKSARMYFLELLPVEYQNVFTKVIAAENYIEPEQGTRENYLYRLGTNKMVTSLGYDEILFFDDNKAEYEFWKDVYDENLSKKYPVPNKSLTFVRLPFYPRKEIEMYSLKELAKDKNLKNNELAKKINSLFDLTINEPGCKIMMEMIDDFVTRNHENGLTFVDGTKEYHEYYKQLSDKYDEIYDIIDADMCIADKYRDYEEEYYCNLLENDFRDFF